METKTPKIPANNICACAIIYRKSNPSEIFIEKKVDGEGPQGRYPVRVFVDTLCLIGGNWVGPAAKADANPEATLHRELDEELRIIASGGNADEMESLGFGAGADGRDLQKDTQAAADDIERFALLKESMLSAITPFMDALIMIPKTLFDSADPENKRGDTTVLASYFTIGLNELDWRELVRLQEKYGNLSNESVTLITNPKEMLDKRMVVSWGHDRVLNEFFAEYSDSACFVPLVGGIKWKCLGMPMSSYDEYKELYEIAKQP